MESGLLTGGRRQALGVGISILRNLPLAGIGGAVEDETAMEAVPDSKSGERATAGGRILRLPHLDGEAAGWQPPA